MYGAIYNMFKIFGHHWYYYHYYHPHHTFKIQLKKKVIFAFSLFVTFHHWNVCFHAAPVGVKLVGGTNN